MKRQVIILPWIPGENWEELSSLPMAIDMGMCGEWGYYSWEMSKKMDVYKDDIFMIVSSKCKTPDSRNYNWLKHMGIPVGPFSGLCFLGTIRDVSSNDTGNQEIDLNILFGILPGVCRTIELEELEKILPSVDWNNSEETILDEQQGDTLLASVRNWLKKEESYLVNNPYTNVINREMDDVIEEL